MLWFLARVVEKDMPVLEGLGRTAATHHELAALGLSRRRIGAHSDTKTKRPPRVLGVDEDRAGAEDLPREPERLAFRKGWNLRRRRLGRVARLSHIFAPAFSRGRICL